MPRLSPDHRGLAAIQAATEGKEQFHAADPRETALFHLVKSQVATQSDVDDAFVLYKTEEDRHIMNALILANGSDALISSSLEISFLVSSAYRWLFFERTVFRHVLDIRAWIAEQELTKQERKYYETAVLQGPEALAEQFSIGKRPNIDPKDALQDILTALYARAQEHKGLAITDPTAQASLRVAKDASAVAALLIDKGGQQVKHALEDLKTALSLETEDLTKRPEDLGIDPKTIAG